MKQECTTPVADTSELALRPTILVDDQVEHPDDRPCPPWCWVSNHNPDGYAHEIDDQHILTKVHSLDSTPDVRASLYAGEKVKVANTGCYEIHTATIEPHLVQYNQAHPVINVALRHYKQVRREGRWLSRMEFDAERLKLTLDDACELVTALEYLIDVATGTRAPIIDHGGCGCPEGV